METNELRANLSSGLGITSLSLVKKRHISCICFTEPPDP